MNNSYRELIVWQKAHLLALIVYRITRSFPSDERNSMVRQLREAASAISSNIVKSHHEPKKIDQKEFIARSEASLEQTLYLLILARDLDYFSRNYFSSLSELCIEIKELLKEFNQTPEMSLPIHRG